MHRCLNNFPNVPFGILVLYHCTLIASVKMQMQKRIWAEDNYKTNPLPIPFVASRIRDERYVKE